MDRRGEEKLVVSGGGGIEREREEEEREKRGAAGLLSATPAIWLILPVVIRLSQRLSHACLSISVYTVKLRMAHYISHSLFESPLLYG